MPDSKTVLAFGTFDHFHPGHSFYLKKARQLGDELHVIVARSQTIQRVKGFLPDNSEMERLNNVQNDKSVTKAILGKLSDHYEILSQLKPDIIALGYDQTGLADNLAAELKSRNLTAEVVRIGSFKPEQHKSSLRRKVKNN